MISIIIILCVLLLGLVIVQISKVSELAATIRGEKEVEQQKNNRTALWLLVFMIVFLVMCCVSALYYKNSMLGYGPHESASEHGGDLDFLFNVTLFFTGVVFVITHIYLFWFAYKYRALPGRKSSFFAHSTMLEIIWTAVPSVVLVGLVATGLIAWNKITGDVAFTDDYMEIEATGSQFQWDIRYPGADNLLGTRDFKKIDPANNPLGQDWSDEKNIDDFHAADIVLPVNKKVRVRINAKDVLHNFYLPHFRVKMDAVPGLPTYFVFTPTKTTDEYRQGLKDYAEWQVPADATEPDGPQRWETFEYELACAELCGKGHYSMRKVVRIVSDEEYQEWLSTQSSYYMSNIRNTNADPFKGELLGIEIAERAKALRTEVDATLAGDDAVGKLIKLHHVFFKTGSAELREISKHELDNVAYLLGKHSTVKVELGGHTDSTGEPNANQVLSEARANSVRNYLIAKGVATSRLTAKGYGQNQPIDSNDTVEGRQANRRTEMKIIAQ